MPARRVPIMRNTVKDFILELPERIGTTRRVATASVSFAKEASRRCLQLTVDVHTTALNVN